MRPAGSPQALEHRRLRAIALLKEGVAPVDVAQRLGVDRRSVRRWKAAHREQGAPRGFKPSPCRGARAPWMRNRNDAWNNCC
jgi:transposase